MCGIALIRVGLPYKVARVDSVHSSHMRLSISALFDAWNVNESACPL